MINTALEHVSRLFDECDRRWDSRTTQHRIGSVLVGTFLVALLAIEANRQGWLPGGLRLLLPLNHFHAVNLAFTLLLLFEVIALVFNLAESVSYSLGKQFEILSLILIRQAIKELTAFQEPVDWTEVKSVVLEMGSLASGALVIFVVLGFYYKSQKRRPITLDTHDKASFIAIKKLISLSLFGLFVLIGAVDLVHYATGQAIYPFFEIFFTVLIFSDILMVLLSLRYSSTYSFVFRNSGYAVATVFIRLALTSPNHVSVLLGVGAAVFALGVTLAYNAFAPILQQADQEVHDHKHPMEGKGGDEKQGHQEGTEGTEGG